LKKETLIQPLGSRRKAEFSEGNLDGNLGWVVRTPKIHVTAETEIQPRKSESADTLLIVLLAGGKCRNFEEKIIIL